MTLHFTKMHALGNDFIIINALTEPFNLTSKEISQLSNRFTGIGFDQCLVVEPAKQEHIDFHYRIFNANGKEVGQCGNGARCLALFLHHYGLTKKNPIIVSTNTTQMGLFIENDTQVTIHFGRPTFAPKDLPFLSTTTQISYPIHFHNVLYSFHIVNVGNPHAVLIVDHIETAPVETLGQFISEHDLFPQQTNVEFMQMTHPHQMRLRVYERGCGETLACGSGAVAAAVAGVLYHHMQSPITVELQKGSVTVTYAGADSDVYLTGEASFVYEGTMLNLPTPM